MFGWLKLCGEGRACQCRVVGWGWEVVLEEGLCWINVECFDEVDVDVVKMLKVCGGTEVGCAHGLFSDG